MAFISIRVYMSLVYSSIHAFDRLPNACSRIMYLSILVTVLAISEAKSNCTVNGINYICNNIATHTDFPLVLPTNVLKVTLRGTNEIFKSFPLERFTHQTWANVSELSVLEFTNVDRIESGFLNGLKELKVISISSCTLLKVIDHDTFKSTPNIEELHLDFNSRLQLYMVESALFDKMSNLRYLSIIAIQRSKQHVVLGKNFSMALHRKNLTYFDISRVNAIYVEHVIVHELLANLIYLNLSYSTIILPQELSNKSKSFLKNMQLLDLTGVQYMSRKYMIQGEKQFKAAEFPMAKHLFLKDMFNPDSKVCLDVIIRFENCDIKFPKMLDLSKNRLTRLNITFLGACRANELETINLASNNIEYISPNILSMLPSLKIIDLSNNRLMKMQDLYEFSNMFSQNNDLEIVYSRYNHLTFVPSDLFLSNSKIQIIDLSENELTYFNINLHKAENLKLINLARNRLRSLPVSFLVQFESIRWKQKTEINQRSYATNVLFKQFHDKSLIGKMYRYGYNASEEIQFDESHYIIPQYVMIDILENQFVCDCDTLAFMEWILLKNIDIINKTVLSCKYSNNQKLLSNELFQNVQTDCQLASNIGIGVASSIAIIISIVTFAITIRLRRKWKRQNIDLENLKKEILQENANFEFLVFLSYCSRDAQIVEENILPSLNKNLRETFNTERDIVCTGDNYFVPGMRIIEEIHRCINKSLVVVPVITPAFLQSDWSQEECVAAVERNKKVVILMKKHTDTSKAILTIQDLIGQYTRGTWSDNEGVFDIRPSWNAICEGIIRAASEALRHYRRRKFTEPAKDAPLAEEPL
ncbi:hypothetical protein ACJMK2_000689 [Sinanodonta woodiana]|uniref:TIR domain-containing protein n=1 Tax=Sinanodonta woodiana TaxID=1069815 RepID=A0ABD3XQ23_SINWO